MPESGHKFGYPVEIGKEFTATCLLHHKDFKADKIVWSYTDATGKKVVLPREYYRKINESAGSITVNVTEDMQGFFTCTVADYETLMFTDCSTAYGIVLDKGCEFIFLLTLWFTAVGVLNQDIWTFLSLYLGAVCSLELLKVTQSTRFLPNDVLLFQLLRSSREAHRSDLPGTSNWIQDIQQCDLHLEPRTRSCNGHPIHTISFSRVSLKRHIFWHTFMSLSILILS